MSTKKVKQIKSDLKYNILLDLIGVITIATFAYTTSMIVVAYQMGY
ncbi:MAG: hypothetical protein RJB24_209 [Candidatus Parcubacteria bacterium]|jgi:hypothetical protein